MLIDVNPGILAWARKESGYATPEVVATKLKLDASRLLKWEADGQKIDFDVLESIAKLYKRQTAVFFLPGVPQKIPKPKDYRNISVSPEGLSPETLLAIRRTDRYLQTAREITSNWKAQYEWKKNFDGELSHIKQEADFLRVLLESPIEEQINQNYPDQAFRYWRNKVEEKLNIFVFQFAMPDDELDGFSYVLDKFPYAIVINNKKQSVRKIFTLFHELAHILKNKPGICNTNYSTNDGNFEIELECNNFAGSFLVPKKSIEAISTADDIFRIARLLNVSGEVYLRRLLDESRIDKTYFFELLKQVRSISQNFPKKNKIMKKGGPSMLIQSKSTRGNRFFNLIANAAQASQISFSTASDLLGLKIGSIRT